MRAWIASVFVLICAAALVAQQAAVTVPKTAPTPWPTGNAKPGAADIATTKEVIAFEKKMEATSFSRTATAGSPVARRSRPTRKRAGRYLYLPRTTAAPPSTSHQYVWFERVYQKRTGQWTHLSHKTVKGPLREDNEPAQ